jgi:hypothetical protein
VTDTLLPPADLSRRKPTHVLPNRTGCFRTPADSLLAFIPLRLFSAFAAYSNLYAHHAMKVAGNNLISGAKWEFDISLQEIMVFFGILIKMVLRPTPGQCYTTCWHDKNWHPYTRTMKLRRFIHIRAVFHFNDNSKMEGSSDAAFKVRRVFILCNCLK